MVLAIADSDCVNGAGSQPSVTSTSFTPGAGEIAVILAGCYAGTGDDASSIGVSDSLGSTYIPIEILSQAEDGAGALPPQPLGAWYTTDNPGVARTVTTSIISGTGFSHVQGRFTLSGQNGATPVPTFNGVRFGTATGSIPLTSPVDGCIALAMLTDFGNNFDLPVAEAGTTQLCSLVVFDQIQSSFIGYKSLPTAGATTIGIQALAAPQGTLGIGVIVQPAADDEANATMDLVLPVPSVEFEADAIAAATMDMTLPVPAVVFEADAVASAAMDVTLPVPAVAMAAAAEAGAAMDIVLPAPAVAMGATAEAAASMDIVLPAPDIDFTADNEAANPDMFTAYADRLLGCLCAQWQAGDPLKPGRCCFRFDGDMPTMGIALNEDECKCGTAWVRVVDWFVSSDSAFPGPTQDVTEQNCPMMWGLVLEMGIGRCPPTGDERNLPSCDALNAFHGVVMDDGRRLRNAIYCCFGTVDPMDRFVVGNPERLGPQGKCYQQTLTVTVMVMNCNEC